MTLQTTRDRTIIGEGFTLTLDEHLSAATDYMNAGLDEKPLDKQFLIVAHSFGDIFGWNLDTTQAQLAINDDFRELVIRSVARLYIKFRWQMPLSLAMAWTTLSERES